MEALERNPFLLRLHMLKYPELLLRLSLSQSVSIVGSAVAAASLFGRNPDAAYRANVKGSADTASAEPIPDDGLATVNVGTGADDVFVVSGRTALMAIAAATAAVLLLLRTTPSPATTTTARRRRRQGQAPTTMAPPPLAVVVRNVRPYVPAAFVLAWAYVRVFGNLVDGTGGGGAGGCAAAAVPAAAAAAPDPHARGECVATIAAAGNLGLMGLLDVLVLLFRRASGWVVDATASAAVTAEEAAIGAGAGDDGDDRADAGTAASASALALALTSMSALTWRLATRMAHAASLLLNDLLGLLLLRSVLYFLYNVRRTSVAEALDSVIELAFQFASRHDLGSVRSNLEKEEESMLARIEDETKDATRTITRTLPSRGTSADDIVPVMRARARREDDKWKKGLVSGTVYSGDDEHTKLLNDVYAAYSWSNPLHADVWPSVNQFEAEVVSMTANLLNGGDANVVGAMTSGGTESIVLAVRSSLVHFGRGRGVRRPEILCSATAHAGLDKACELMNIRLIRLDPDPVTFELRPFDVERNVTSDTILVYASAPCFPQGTIDPIEKLSDLALRYGVGLHVDACLGGFVLPFAKKLGYDVPDFDFGCRGVTSMSVDTHKYGYATKGTSVVLYRHKDLRRAQYFTYPHWTGGLYATPTIAGSRAGGLLACAWASMIHLGEEGYLHRTKLIMDATRKVAYGVADIPGLVLMGGMPRATIVCFGSNEFDIYRVGDKMTEAGWSLNALQRPPCLHLCVTLPVVANADQFVVELSRVVEEVWAEENDGKKKKKKTGNAAIYGLAGSLPPGPVASLLKCYTDAMLTP